MMRVFLTMRQPTTSSGAVPMILYAAYSYGMSALLVGVNILVAQLDLGDGHVGYGEGLCYISTKKMIAFTFAMPVGFVVISNLAMFLAVVCKIHNLPKVQKSGDRNNLKIYAKLSTITGVTWVFGFVAEWTSVEALSYVFIILNASQGVFIMLSFVCNGRVLNLYKTCGRAGARYAESPRATSGQSVTHTASTEMSNYSQADDSHGKGSALP
jgi:G protein-coupled receptor Mth (Methuselah protein)